MSTIKRFAKNVSYLYTANIINRLLNLVLFVYIARYLHDTGLGQYSFILAFVGLFSMVHELGFYVIISREVAKDRTRASDYVVNTLLIKVGLSVITLFLIIFSINFLDYPPQIKNLIYMYMITVFFFSFATPFRALFIAYEKMEYEAAVNTLERLIIVPISIAVLLKGYGLQGLITVLLISGITIFSLSVLIVYKKISKLTFSIDLHFCRELLKTAIPFVFLGVFNTIYTNIDMVMLSKIAGDAATGWYNAAYRPLNALLFIPALFMGAIFPAMSRFSVSSRDSLFLAYKKSLQYMLTLALPLALGISLLADRIIIRMYGDVFFNSIITLQILVWGTALMFLNNVLLSVLISMGKEKLNTKIVAWGVALNVVLNLFLIPRLLQIGASIATVAAEATFFVLCFYHLSKSLRPIPIHKLAIRPAFASLIMASFIMVFREEVTLFIIIPLAAALYFVVLFLIRGISEEDYELVKKLGR